MASVSPSLANNTITVTVSKESPYVEAFGSEDLYPGMMVDLASTNEYRVAPTGVTLWTFPMFVVENPYWGKSITSVYLTGERLMLRVPRRGDIILTKVSAIVEDALEIGMHLTPAGDGWMRDWRFAQDVFPTAESLEADPTPVFPRWTAVRIF